MSYSWQIDLRPQSRSAATFLPPATVEETAWDILLALRAGPRCELALDRLSQIVSAPEPVLTRWLDVLEQRQLVTGVLNEITRELSAVLTRAGRDLLDGYLSATSGLQAAGRA